MSDAEDLANENEIDLFVPDEVEEVDEEIDGLPEELSDLAVAGGTEDDRQRRQDRTRRRELRHKTIEVTAALASIAIVYWLAGFVQLGVLSPFTTGLATLLMGTIYGGIAYWARMSPFRATKTAVGFCMATVVIAVIVDPGSVFRASNFVLVALIFAVVFARQHRSLERRFAASV